MEWIHLIIYRREDYIYGETFITQEVIRAFANLSDAKNYKNWLDQKGLDANEEYHISTRKVF